MSTIIFSAIVVLRFIRHELSPSWHDDCARPCRSFALACEYRQNVHTQPAESHVLHGLPANLTHRVQIVFETIGNAREVPSNRTSHLQIVFQTKRSLCGIPTNRTNRLQTILQTVHAA